MRSRLLRALVVCAALAMTAGRQAHVAAQSSAAVVISEFRTRGPNGGNDEFIELYNRTSTDVAIGGWKVNGSNASGTVSTRVTIAAGVTLGPGCYYLATNSASGGYSGAVPGNQTYGTGITDEGGIALLMPDNTIVDQVGMNDRRPQCDWRRRDIDAVRRRHSRRSEDRRQRLFSPEHRHRGTRCEVDCIRGV